MKLHHKVRSVEQVYQRLEKEVATFKDATGLQCFAGCGMCCTKPDIAAAPLEFLPLAFHLFQTDQALAWLEKINSEPQNTICSVFKPFHQEKGFCSIYAHRGLICRLFGFSAMLDKHGQPRLVTCQPIKTQTMDAFKKAEQHIMENSAVPIMRNYYFQLRNIDPDLGQMLLPINQAIAKALETVLAYYAYRKPKRA